MAATCREFGHRWGADVARNCWRCVYCTAVVEGPTLDLNDPIVSYGKRSEPAHGDDDEVERGADGNPLPLATFPPAYEDDAEPEPPRCGLCRAAKPLAPGRTICADCAFFPLD